MQGWGSSSLAAICHDIRCQERQSRYRRCVSRAQMRAVTFRTAEVVEAMTPCDHHGPRHPYSRLRSRRIAGVSDPLSVATVRAQVSAP